MQPPPAHFCRGGPRPLAIRASPGPPRRRLAGARGAGRPAPQATALFDIVNHTAPGRVGPAASAWTPSAARRRQMVSDPRVLPRRRPGS